jgi:hypothetical protein
LIQHQHTAIGDPTPCADTDLHVGNPVIDDVQAGAATEEYEGLFRLVEQAGMQPAAVDIAYSDEPLKRFPLAFLPGSPVIEHVANERLRRFAHRGGVLVLSGPWPARDERGRRLAFLGLRKPSRIVKLGKGQLIWQPRFIGRAKPEEDALESIEWVSKLLRRHVRKPHIRIRPADEVAWTDWQEGGGSRLYCQEHNLGSAILHRSADELILFVLNHYPEAARFEVEFCRDRVRKLQNLSTGEIIVVRKGRAILDVDRKSAEIFRVQAIWP